MASCESGAKCNVLSGRIMEALSGRSCWHGASLVKLSQSQPLSKRLFTSRFVGSPLRPRFLQAASAKDRNECLPQQRVSCSALGSSRPLNRSTFALPNPGNFGLDDDERTRVAGKKNLRGARIVCQSLKMEDKYKSLKARRLLREMEEVRDQGYDRNGKSTPWGKPKKKGSGNEGKKKSEMDGDHNGIAPWSKRMRINYGDDVEEQDYGLDYWEDDKQNVAAMMGKHRHEVTKGGNTYGGQFARANRGSKRTIIDTADMAKLVAERPGTKAALATGVVGYLDQFDPEVLERGSALFEDPAEVQQRMTWYLESVGVNVEAIDLSKVPGTGEEQEEKVEYLKELGLAQEDVADIIERWPQLLRLSLRKNIKPVIKYLESKWIAFGPDQILELLRKYPQILYHSIELTLQPRVLYLRGLGLTRSQSQDVFLRVPSLFDTRIERAPSTNMAYMAAIGMEIGDMWKVVYGCPEILVRRVNEFLKPRWLGLVNHLGLCEDEARRALLQTPELLLVEDVGVLRKELRTELRRRGLFPEAESVSIASEELDLDAGAAAADGTAVESVFGGSLPDMGMLAAESDGTGVRTAFGELASDAGTTADTDHGDEQSVSEGSRESVGDVAQGDPLQKEHEGVEGDPSAEGLNVVAAQSLLMQGSRDSLRDMAERHAFRVDHEGVKGDPSSRDHETVVGSGNGLLQDEHDTATESGLREGASAAADAAFGVNEPVNGTRLPAGVSEPVSKAGFTAEVGDRDSETGSAAEVGDQRCETALMAEVSEPLSITQLSAEVNDQVSETQLSDGAEAGPSGQDEEPQIHLSRVIALFGHRLNENGVRETLDETIGLLETELGLDSDGLRTVLVMYPGLLELEPEDIRAKVERLRSEGLKGEEIRRMVVARPDWLALDLESAFTPKLECLKAEMGRSVNELVEFPAFLCYSLPDRIALRHQLARDVSSKLPLRTLIGSTWAQFDEAVDRNEWGFEVEELDEPEEAWTVERAYSRQRWEQAKIGAGPVGGLV